MYGLWLCILLDEVKALTTHDQHSATKWEDLEKSCLDVAIDVI